MARLGRTMSSCLTSCRWFVPARSQRALERSIRLFIHRFIAVNPSLSSSFDDPSHQSVGPRSIERHPSVRTLHATKFE